MFVLHANGQFIYQLTLHNEGRVLQIFSSKCHLYREGMKKRSTGILFVSNLREEKGKLKYLECAFL